MHDAMASHNLRPGGRMIMGILKSTIKNTLILLRKLDEKSYRSFSL
nr:MAG TPA: PROTEIN-L-ISOASPARTATE O-METHYLTRANSFERASE [Bacteriophage sp.]